MLNTIAIEHQIWIAVPRQGVWCSITEAVQLAQWWPPDHWDIPVLEVGASVIYGFGLEVRPSTITTVESLREFSVCVEPCAFHPDFRPTTTFSLAEEDGGTRLTLTQTGYEGLPNPCRHYHMAECAIGYESVLENLKWYLEETIRTAHDILAPHQSNTKQSPAAIPLPVYSSQEAISILA